MTRMNTSLFFLLCFLCSCSSLENKSNLKDKDVSCSVAILGGGPAGLYLAYKLAQKKIASICLFEKEEVLGGRFKDETFSKNPGNSNAIWIGTGARRVNEVQSFVLNLGKELGIQFEKPDARSQLIYHHGLHSYSPKDFIRFYPALRKNLDVGSKTPPDDQLWAKLIAHKKISKKYPKLKDFMEAVIGKEGAGFLRGMTRFHGDFDYPVSTENYLDYLEKELKTSTVNLYPIGGMRTFILAFEREIRKSDARVFTSEPLLQLEQETQSAGYQLITSKRKIHADKVVVAIPPSGFNRVSGTLAERIHSQPEYQALIPVRIAVINQWWDKPWWNEVRDPKGNGDSAKVWRAWTDEHCISHTEIPQEKYASEEKVTRSVYSDDPSCVKYWESLNASSGIEEVEKEVVRGLRKVFDNPLNVSPLSIAKPRKTTFHIWDGGWYYVKAGSNISSERIINWSHEPLPEHKSLMFVGEAYWPMRPGWSEGAYFSVEALLRAKFAH